MKRNTPNRDAAARIVGKHVTREIALRLTDDEVQDIEVVTHALDEAKKDVRICAGQIARRFIQSPTASL